MDKKETISGSAAKYFGWDKEPSVSLEWLEKYGGNMALVSVKALRRDARKQAGVKK